MAVRVHQADQRISARQTLRLSHPENHSPDIALRQQRALEHPAHLLSMARAAAADRDLGLGLIASDVDAGFLALLGGDWRGSTGQRVEPPS